MYVYQLFPVRLHSCILLFILSRLLALTPCLNIKVHTVYQHICFISPGTLNQLYFCENNVKTNQFICKIYYSHTVLVIQPCGTCTAKQ